MSKGKKYSHCFTISFEFESDHKSDKVTSKEMLKGLRKRLDSLEENGDEILNAADYDDTINLQEINYKPSY